MGEEQSWVTQEMKALWEGLDQEGKLMVMGGIGILLFVGILMAAMQPVLIVLPMFFAGMRWVTRD